MKRFISEHFRHTKYDALAFARAAMLVIYKSQIHQILDFNKFRLFIVSVFSRTILETQGNYRQLSYMAISSIGLVLVRFFKEP